MMSKWFTKFAQHTSRLVGSPWAFFVAVAALVIWAITGPIFGFSDTWQLVINTSTTIITFLVVFLIQNTQNRDARALHLKLDELIMVTKHARNNLVHLEHLSDAELDRLEKEFDNLGRRVRVHASRRKKATPRKPPLQPEESVSPVSG